MQWKPEKFGRYHYYQETAEDSLTGEVGLSKFGGLFGGVGGGGGAAAPVPPAPGQLAPRAQDLWQRTLPRRTLSRMLRRMRRERGLSQTAVAERIGATQPVIARMESATGPWPGQEAIAAFAAACGRVAVLGFIDAGDRSAVGATADAGGEFVFFPLGGAAEGPAAGPAQLMGFAQGGVYGITAGWPGREDGDEDEVKAGAAASRAAEGGA